jgi:hypothetical protein
MKARLNQWGFQALSFGLAVMFRVADLMPQPQPEGRHRAPGRATRASDREVRAQRDEAARNRRVFRELSQSGSKTLVWVWDGDIGHTWMDEFDIPPLPQRRFRALNPRALAAGAIQDRAALKSDQDALSGDFNRALARLAKEHEVS